MFVLVVVGGEKRVMDQIFPFKVSIWLLYIIGNQSKGKFDSIYPRSSVNEVCKN